MNHLWAFLSAFNFAMIFKDLSPYRHSKLNPNIIRSTQKKKKKNIYIYIYIYIYKHLSPYGHSKLNPTNIIRIEHRHTRERIKN